MKTQGLITNVAIDAIHIEPGKIIEYGGELIDTGETKTEVKILQFVKNFWGVIAVCRVGNIFKEIPLNELKWGEPIDLEKVNAEV
jgi:hypothetical protein